ncbi:hypothetical protein B0181_03820 [Moraxella caviae]|uniref:Uncharacterized protein n=1 Tax=Moraxella caviae TaxID=34060 RepID=A0A1T0A646_9GAMM|nr:hypothetical protein B0181_03820 [Moraxella caviae]
MLIAFAFILQKAKRKPNENLPKPQKALEQLSAVVYSSKAVMAVKFAYDGCDGRLNPICLSKPPTKYFVCSDGLV